MGDPKRQIYYPLELCSIKKQACPNTKKLTEKQTSQMIRHTSVSPDARREIIEKGQREANKKLKADPYAQKFQFSMGDQMVRIDARVLEPPKLSYHGEKEKVPVKPSGGKWEMTGQGRKPLKFVDPKSLEVCFLSPLSLIVFLLSFSLLLLL